MENSQVRRIESPQNLIIQMGCIFWEHSTQPILLCSIYLINFHALAVLYATLFLFEFKIIVKLKVSWKSRHNILLVKHWHICFWLAVILQLILILVLHHIYCHCILYKTARKGFVHTFPESKIINYWLIQAKLYPKLWIVRWFKSSYLFWELSLCVNFT